MMEIKQFAPPRSSSAQMLSLHSPKSSGKGKDDRRRVSLMRETRFNAREW
jgi:hypothetical protein